MIEKVNGYQEQKGLAEVAFSVLKRKYGEEVKSRKYWNQVEEIKIKLVVHKLGRLPKLSIQFK